ncbi:hypothetical protein Neosp_015159 [[Neocosmospora] mangrovei]
MGELMDRLGLSQYARLDTSLMYQSICVNKLQSALEYRLKLLHKAGHVSATFVLPYRAKWKRYTQAWGGDDWNGDMTPPRSHTATSTSISTFSTVATPTPSLGPPPDFPTLSLTTDAILHTPEDQDVVMEDVQDIPQPGLTQQQCAEHVQAFRQQLQREAQQQRAQIQQEQQRQQAAMDVQQAKIKQDAWDVYQARRQHEARVEAHEQTQSQPAPQPPERETGQQALDASFHALQHAELQREFERQRTQIQKEKDIAQAEIAQQRFEIQQQKESCDADIERGRAQHDMLERETQMAQAAIEQARSRLQQERQMNQAEIERERSQLEQQVREFMQVQKEQFQEYVEAQKQQQQQQQQQSTRHQHPSQQEPWQNQQPTQQQPSQQESLQQKPPPALPLQEQPAHQQLAVPQASQQASVRYQQPAQQQPVVSGSSRQQSLEHQRQPKEQQPAGQQSLQQTPRPQELQEPSSLPPIPPKQPQDPIPAEEPKPKGFIQQLTGLFQQIPQQLPNLYQKKDTNANIARSESHSTWWNPDEAEVVCQDSISCRGSKGGSRIFMEEEEPSASDRYMAKKKGVPVSTIVAARHKPAQEPSLPRSTSESATGVRPGPAPATTETAHTPNSLVPVAQVLSLDHERWVQDVMTLAWAIRVTRIDPSIDLTQLRAQLGVLLSQGPPCSTMAAFVRTVCF